MEKHRFKTAEFAALCGVKKDTLLHYDHIGLLKPQWVGENGYRYYSARQLPVYDLIAALRRLGTPLGEIRDYLARRSPQALLELLAEKEEALAQERRRLDQMEALLHNVRGKAQQAAQACPGQFRLEECPEVWCAVVEAPDFAGAGFQEAVYLLHVRQLLTWARAQGSPSQAPGDIICRESLERGRFFEDHYYCVVPPGTTGWEVRIRPGGDLCGAVSPGVLRLGVRRLPPAVGVGPPAGVCGGWGPLRRGPHQRLCHRGCPVLPVETQLEDQDPVRAAPRLFLAGRWCFGGMFGQRGKEIRGKRGKEVMGRQMKMLGEVVEDGAAQQRGKSFRFDLVEGSCADPA